MKRSPMPARRTSLKQGKPPQRKTRLKAGQPPARTPLRPKPPAEGKDAAKQPNPPKRKPARPKPVPAAVKNILRERSGGVCEIGLTCGGSAPGTDPAHREGKKAGGTRKQWSNSASNLLWSCRPCHDLTDQKQPAAAEKLGQKVREGVARPWEVPCLHARLGWVLLDDEGGHRPAPEGSHPAGKRPTPVVAVAQLDWQDRAFAEALARYGHDRCPQPDRLREGLHECGCGAAPFWVEVAS